MEWKFLSILHFTVTTAEFLMLNVPRFGITAFIWKPFEHTCFFCSCTTFLCVFQNFHIVDISKQFMVILKTLLEINLRVSSSLQGFEVLAEDWSPELTQFHESTESVITEMPKQKILELLKYNSP